MGGDHKQDTFTNWKKQIIIFIFIFIFFLPPEIINAVETHPMYVRGQPILIPLRTTHNVWLKKLQSTLRLCRKKKKTTEKTSLATIDKINNRRSILIIPLKERESPN